MISSVSSAANIYNAMTSQRCTSSPNTISVFQLHLSKRLFDVFTSETHRHFKLQQDLNQTELLLFKIQPTITKLILDRATCLIKQVRIGNILRLFLPYLEHEVHYQTLSNQYQTLPQIYSIHFFPFSLSLCQFRKYFPLS